MPATLELLPHTPERLEFVGNWITDHLKPVERAIDQDAIDLEFEQIVDQFEVREYQLEAWSNLWNARQQGATRGLVSLATGLGKTSVAVFDVMKFREEGSQQDPPMLPRILFVSHMTDINDQAKKRFEHFMPELDIDIYASDKGISPQADMTFATFQSLENNLDNIDPQSFEYIIYDEAHHTEADTYSKVRDHFDPLFELALTATPERADGRKLEEYFGEPLYEKDLAHAMAEGWLADVEYHLVFDEIVKGILAEGFNPGSMNDFRKLFAIKPRNEAVAQNILAERTKLHPESGKTIVFCKDVKHAKEMAKLLSGQAYYSGLKSDKRKQILEDFKSGAQDIICTVDMFNEGIDIPDAAMLVMLRSTASKTIFEQQLGRGLRKTRGKEKVVVLDYVGNIERIKMVKEMVDTIREVRQATNPNDKIDGDARQDDVVSIHLRESDFIFEKQTIDMLERYSALTQETPGDVISFVQASRRLGLAERTLLPYAIEVLGKLERYDFHTHRDAPGMTHAELELVKAHPEVAKRILDPLKPSVYAASVILRTSPKRLNEIIDEMGIEPEEYIVRGRPAFRLNQTQMDLLRAHPDLDLPPPPEGVFSVKEAYTMLGISERDLQEVIEQEGWELPRYVRRRPGRYLSQDQIDHVRSLNIQKRKQGWQN